MNVIFDIAAHELARLIKSPTGWIVLAIVQFLLAVIFLFLLNRFIDPSAAPLLAKYGVTSTVVATFLRVVGIVLLLFAPFLTMNTISEERQTGTLQLLRSSPVSAVELVAGKYLGIVSFFLLLLAVIALMPLSLLLGAGTRLDLWQFGLGVLGIMLLVSTFIAVGVFMSTLTHKPLLAATGTFGALFMFWMTGITDGTGWWWSEQFLEYLALFGHYRHLIDGRLSSTVVVYYLLVSVVFLALSVWRLDDERYY